MKNSSIRSLALAVMALALLVAIAAPSAMARKVANPGPVSFQAIGGTLKIGSMDPSDLTPQPGDPAITISGTVASNGAVTVPQSNIVFPPISFDTGSVGVATVNINPVGNGTGTINPLNGASTLQIKFYISITGIGLLGNNCTIGTSSSPIVLNMTSGTSGSRTGVPYDPNTGVATLVDGTFAVPAATNCSLGTSTVNDQLGLPSPSGNNFLDLVSQVTPAIQPGVKAAFVANPSTGPAPLTTSFDASSSTALALPASYRWDYDNNGTTDFTTSNPSDPAATHLYAVPGTYTARLTVVDADGDSSTVTHNIVVAVPHPDLAVTKTVAVDPLLTGVSQDYLIDVSNVGTLATSGPAMVTDVLPAGLTYDGFSGSGWSCSEAVGIVTCQYANSLAIGAAAPTLHISVTPDESALGFVTNTASVATIDDVNPSNDSSSVTTQVIASGVDLVMHKTHDADDGLLRGQRATYDISVSNAGTVDTDPLQRTRVTDTLPVGTTFVSASGTGWTCLTDNLPTVRCFTDDVIPAGGSAPILRIRVEITSDAPDILSNTAEVTNAGDTTLSNNSGTDLGSVSGYGADFQITKSHSGDFILDQPGTYTIKIKNVGTKTAGDVITVTDTLPDGLVPTAASGADDPDSIDWTCNIVGQAVTCTYPGPVEPGGEPEPITINVTPGDAAVGTVTNIATVSSPDDHNGANDSASDDTLVRSPLPDLSIDKSHTAASFTVGQNAVYTLAVTNASNEPTRGTTTVTDVLPAGLTYVSATGSGWTCGAVGQAVTCTRSTPIQGLTTTSITLTVNVGAAAAPGVTNTASVSAANDTNSANNSDSDPAAVVNPPKPTTITADGAVATINVATIRVGLDGMRAVIKSGATPVAGKRLWFTTANGTALCNGVSSSTGEVRCGTVLITMLQAALGTNYRVYFLGDDQYTPSSASGPLVLIPTIKLF